MATEPDPRLVYALTLRGHDEVSEARLALGAGARRILPLVDGQRCIGDLDLFARPGELGPIVAELESQRLIEVCGVVEEPTEAQRRARASTELALLAQSKRRVEGLFDAELGPAGHVWEARVADSVNMAVLRRVLREAVDVVYFRSGEEAARRIVAAVRPIFEQMQQPR